MRAIARVTLYDDVGSSSSLTVLTAKQPEGYKLYTVLDGKSKSVEVAVRRDLKSLADVKAYVQEVLAPTAREGFIGYYTDI